MKSARWRKEDVRDDVVKKRRRRKKKAGGGGSDPSGGVLLAGLLWGPVSGHERYQPRVR